jgi:ribosomal protein S5
MTLLEKYGLFFMLLGSSTFLDEGWRGGLGVLILVGGWIAFTFRQAAHLTPDAADGAIGSAKNDLFDVEWVDDKTIRLKPHR